MIVVDKLRHIADLKVYRFMGNASFKKPGNKYGELPLSPWSDLNACYAISCLKR